MKMSFWQTSHLLVAHKPQLTCKYSPIIMLWLALDCCDVFFARSRMRLPLKRCRILLYSFHTISSLTVYIFLFYLLLLYWEMIRREKRCLCECAGCRVWELMIEGVLGVNGRREAEWASSGFKVPVDFGLMRLICLYYVTDWVLMSKASMKSAEFWLAVFLHTSCVVLSHSKSVEGKFIIRGGMS